MTGTVDIQELKKLAEAATAGNLDTVPNPPNEYGGKDKEGCVVCPQCDGEGAVDAVTYTNFDGVAMGVQFFGIGDEFQRYEAYFRAASPSTILALIEENERLREAAEYYFDTFCELGPSHEACGKLHRDQCSGCVARQAMEGPSK